jgi:hypothetical protein
MQRRRLRVPQRQLAVAAQGVRKEEHVPGAVHGLDREEVILLGDQEHVLAELLPVARPLPEHLVVDERGLDLEVAAAFVLAAA